MTRLAETVTVRRLTEPEELLHLDGDGQPCPVHLDFDLEDGVLMFDFSYPNHGTPESVYNRRRFRLAAACFTAEYGNTVLDDALPLARRILAGASIVWDGNNNVGQLNGDATEALDELTALVAGLSDGAPTLSVMDAAEWFAVGDQPADMGLTADTTDDELTALVERVETEIRGMEPGQVTAPVGVEAYLWTERDRMRVVVADELGEVAEQLAELTRRRNRLIGRAMSWRDAAYSSRTVGGFAGLSHARVQKIAAVHGLLVARDNAPDWAEHLAKVGVANAAALEESGRHLGGLRITDVGGGWVALDGEAVQALQEQPRDADGHISKTPTTMRGMQLPDGGRLEIWIGGSEFEILNARLDAPIDGTDVGWHRRRALLAVSGDDD